MARPIRSANAKLARCPQRQRSPVCRTQSWLLSGGVDPKQPNTLAVDFDGVAVDDGNDPDNAILRDRDHSHGQNEQNANDEAMRNHGPSQPTRVEEAQPLLRGRIL